MIFIENKYQRTYFNIIDNAIQSNRIKSKDFYFENHHVYPRSLFPKLKNNKLNLVLLTAKEHFICHHLLTKITSGEAKSKMVYAYFLMTVKGDKQYDRYSPPSSQYENIKLSLSKVIRANKKKIECKHCLKLFDIGNFKRHHGERCKLNSNRKSPEVYKCEHCLKETENKALYNKYHSSNCKLNPNRLQQKIYKCDFCDTETEHKLVFWRLHGEKCKANPNNRP